MPIGRRSKTLHAGAVLLLLFLHAIVWLPSGAAQGAEPSVREPGTWERHKGYIVGTVVVVTLQTALLGSLLIQRARRRRAEEQTRRSEERYRSVVETQSELICRFLPDSTLTFVNDAYCRFWNKTRDELLGLKFVELIPPSARDAVRDRIGRLR